MERKYALLKVKLINSLGFLLLNKVRQRGDEKNIISQEKYSLIIKVLIHRIYP